MSKLPAVLCAAIFIGLALMVASEFEAVRRSTIQHIVLIRACIERRISQIRQMIAHTSSLSTNEYVEELAELKQNITNEMKLTQLLVNDTIGDPINNGTFNETKCRSYYVDYEENEREADKNLDQHISNAMNVTLTQLGKMVNETLEEVEKLNDLDKKSRSCRRIDCDILRSRANLIKSNVLWLTRRFPCKYEGPSTALEALLRTAFNLFIQKGQIVMKNTLDCVFNGHPPHIPHGHHHHHYRHRL